MKKLFLTIALLSLSTFNVSTFASSGDHSHSEKKEKPKCTAEHAALGHCTMEEDVQLHSGSEKGKIKCTAEHAALGHCKLETDIDKNGSKKD